MIIYGITVIVCAFLIRDVTAQRCNCGYKNRCCAFDETCEEDVAGGTCYKTADRVSCDVLYYCYKPTTCCGFGSCCPVGASCCGENTCCPKESTCCGSGYLAECCGADTTCENGRCRAESSSGWYTYPWYYVFFIVPAIAVCLLVGRRRYANRARARAQGPVVLSSESPESRNSPYPTATFAPPPQYDEIANTAPSGGANAGYGPKMPEPPPYEEVVSQSPSAPFKESHDEPPDSAGNENNAYEADHRYNTVN